MSIATTSSIISCGAAAVATSENDEEQLHPTKYDGWILLGIIVFEVGCTLLCYFWPW